MKRVLAQEVRSLVLTNVGHLLAAKGLNPAEVPDDFDLLMEGVIDSQGLIELILAVEQKFQLQLDFEELDPEHLTVMGPFCRYIEEKSGAANQQTA